jgi:alkylhydroperoxidase family enzyme
LPLPVEPWDAQMLQVAIFVTLQPESYLRRSTLEARTQNAELRTVLTSAIQLLASDFDRLLLR